MQRLRKVWVNGGYRGDDLRTWVAQLKQTHKIDSEGVKEKGTGFTVLLRRWVVERTFAWLLNYRRHSKDCAVLTRNSEAFIQVAMIQLLIRRLAKKIDFLKQLLSKTSAVFQPSQGVFDNPAFGLYLKSIVSFFYDVDASIDAFALN